MVRLPTRQTHILTAFSLVLLPLVWKTWSQNNTWISRESLFKSGVKMLPHNAKVYYNYANYLKDTGSQSAATDHYRVAVDLYPDYPSAHNNLGTLLSNKTQAEYHFRRALELNADHKGAHVNLGLLLFKRGEREQGIHLVRHALEIDPSYEEALAGLASMMVEMDNWTEADHLYRSALDNNPTSAQLYHNYGTFLHRKGDEERALEFYQIAVEMDPHHTLSLVETARCLKNQGKLDQAEHRLLQALRQREDDTTVDLLAVVYFEMGRIREALRLYEGILQLRPNNTDILFHYAQVLAKNLEFDKSEVVLHQAIHVSPNSIEVLTQMSKNLGRQGRHKEALSYIDHAITVARRTNDKQAQLYLFFQQGDHHKDLQEYQKAVKSYSEALRLGGSNANLHLNLGALHHILGNLTEARQHYTQVLSVEPGHSIARDNLYKLDRLQSQQRVVHPGQ